MLYRYNVTRIRAAACCPRIHYFDAEEERRKGLKKRPLTRIWTEGDSSTAGGGKLFHTVVERFNHGAGASPSIGGELARARGGAALHQVLMRFINTTCIEHDKLKEKPIALRQHFISALSQYVAELSIVIEQAFASGIQPSELIEQLFRDDRKRVDTTFHVGDNARVHVTGVVDYVYRDPVTGRHRIVDYKLTPPTHPHKDMMQVATYALMHHHQHRTEPDALVYYLYPKRQVVERAWGQVHADRAKVYDLLASMVRWEAYDEETGQGLKPIGDPTYCAACKWDSACEKRLGAKEEGEWDRRWESLTAASPGQQIEPESRAVHPPRSIPIDTLTEGRVPEEAEAHAAIHDAAEREPSDTVRDVKLPEVAQTLQSAGTPVHGGSPSGCRSQGEVEVEPGPKPEQQPKEPLDAHAPGELRLGALYKGENLRVSMASSVLHTHVAVVGAAGSGKTWMAKVIAEEAILAGIPVLAVDPQGDLVQFLRFRPEHDVPAEYRESYKRYRALVEPRVFTPGSSHATRLSLDPVRLPTQDDLAKIADPQRREEERGAMISAVANNLVSLCKAGGETDSQRNFLYQLLRAVSGTGRLSLNRIVEYVHEPEQAGIDDADLIVKKAEREKLARKLHGFVSGPSASLFEGGVPLDVDQLLSPSAPGRVPLNVIYLNGLTDDDQKHFFVATLASEIYRWMVTSLDTHAGSSNLLFYIDEARDYIPAGGKKPAAKEPLMRLFTQGRKYGIGCLLCTQSPRSVDYTVFGNCSAKIVGRMEAAQDVERIAEWFSTSGAVPTWVSRRKGADRGTFVGRWPGIAAELSGKPFQTRMLFSAHEGAWSPDRLEREIRSDRK